MIIYEFSTWCTNGKMFGIEEIEVEEKPKTYISTNAQLDIEYILKRNGG